MLSESNWQWSIESHISGMDVHVTIQPVSSGSKDAMIKHTQERVVRPAGNEKRKFAVR